MTFTITTSFQQQKSQMKKRSNKSGNNKSKIHYVHRKKDVVEGEKQKKTKTEKVAIL